MKTDPLYLRTLVHSLCSLGPRPGTGRVPATDFLLDEVSHLFPRVCYTMAEPHYLYFPKVSGPLTEKRLLLMAHVDTVQGTMGAEDNASGVAGVLALAKLLKQDWQKIPVSLLFTSREEPPFFGSDRMGSAVFFREHPGIESKLALVVNVDCVGFFPRTEVKAGSEDDDNLLSLYQEDRPFLDGGFITSHSDMTLRMFGEDALPVHTSRSGLSRLSDLLWVPESVPSVHLFDGSVFYENNYHLPEDTPDTLDYERMAKLIDHSYDDIKRYFA